MQNAAFLLIAVGVVLIGLCGIGIYQLMNRPRSDSGIDEFRNARDALAMFHHDGSNSGRRRRKR